MKFLFFPTVQYSFLLILICFTVNPLSANNKTQNILQIQNALLEANREQPICIELPLPNGEIIVLNAEESSVMEEPLQKEFSNIRSYLVFGANEFAKGRLAVSPYGLSGVVLTNRGTLFIEPTPTERNKNNIESMPYDIYWDRTGKAGKFTCEVEEIKDVINDDNPMKSSVNCLSIGNSLRNYRIAIASSGEFTNGIGAGSTTQTTAIINERLSALNVIMENELSIHLNLIANNTSIIFNNAATDGLNPSNKIISAHSVITNTIGSANFDIGHVFHEELPNGTNWTTNGLGGTGVCVDTWKGRGWSGFSFNTPLSEVMYLFCHEVGHQFDARHSFYGTDGSCGPGRSVGNGYEPGSGNTLMSYEGRCDSHNIIPEKIAPYYGIHSLFQINEWALDHNCELTSASSNSLPLVNVPADYTIPKGTPFWVEGTANDANGDLLTYCWEQYDTDMLNLSFPQGNPNDAATSTTAPLFRSFDPSTTGAKRYFPQFSDVVSGIGTLGETLAQVARDIHLRLTVRDNYGDIGIGFSGGVSCEEMTVAVANSGPLQITYPTANNILNSGTIINFTWNTNGSSNLCTNADIYLSTNGGDSFPYLLAENIPYSTGSLQVSIPAGVTNTTQGRIIISCSDNPDIQFYAVNSGNFTINSSCQAYTSFICPDEPLEVNSGSSALNLGLSSFAGENVDDFFFNVNSNSPSMNFIRRDANDNCEESQDAFFPYNSDYDSHEFVVTEDGLFSIVNLTPGFTVFSIFYADTFDPNSPCNSFVATNGYDNPNVSDPSSTSISATINVELDKCTRYLIAAYNFNSPFTTNIEFNGPGEVVAYSDNVSTDYSYSYVAVNQATGIIAAVNANANFSSLSGGMYNIYGFSYKSGGPVNPPNLSPNSLVGQSFQSAFTAGSCFLISENTKSVEVMGTSSGGFMLSLKLLLEGAYGSSGQMNTNITNFIPSNQPYNVLPYNYFGNESLSQIPNNMVDWVLVEARSGTPNESGSKGTVTVETKAGVLRSNGTVTDVNGNPLSFTSLNPSNNYYFCVRHRNHLDILTSTSVLASGTASYDLTSSVNQAFGNQQMVVSSDGFVMFYAGDFNSDGVIQNTDYDVWKFEPALVDVYNYADGNLDGVVQVTDYDVWFPNKAKVGIVEIGF